jgi:hypothetical protein
MFLPYAASALQWQRKSETHSATNNDVDLIQGAQEST